MFDISGLNPEQKKAASTIKGPLLLLAGAGSGKTRTVTFRIAHMIENLGIAPSQILAVSFTNKAAAEMRERVRKLLGSKKIKGITLSTFHSLGLQILKEEYEKLGFQGPFTIYDQTDSLSILREGLKAFKAKKEAFDRKQIQSKISFLKNKGISAEDFATSKYFDSEDQYDVATEHLYRYYQERLHFYHAIDFDDILFLSVKLFRENPDVAKKFSRRFQYIMIDEYQDTNELQFEMVEHLTCTHNNICVVGDDDQSIYAFRGADISNILNFNKQYEGCTVIKLEQNYRSTNHILKLANEVISQNKQRSDKTMFSSNNSGEKPLLWLCQDTAHEAQIVIEDIVNVQKDGKSLNDLAILYRSNTQVPALEDQLRLSQVPYKIIGGQKLYEKKEIKDLIAYLCLIRNPRDQIALRRIINVPHRGIGAVTISKIVEIGKSSKAGILNAMKSHAAANPGKQTAKYAGFPDMIYSLGHIFKEKKLSEAISELVQKIDYYSYIEKSYDSAQQAGFRKLDIEQLILSAERFEQKFGKKATLDEFLEKILLADSQDTKDEEEKKNEITLMTLHSSKGLEFEQVYLVGMEEELLPHKRTIVMGEDISEERRLCYVGITRAKQKLIMSYIKERKLYGKVAPRHKSRFLVGVEELYTEQDRTTFGHMTKEEAEQYKSNFFADLSSMLD
jgi:DNA helicase-2/ATP-dependent DNA helicase PcrA